MLPVTASVPRAASCTLRAISAVAAPCSSMAAAIEVEIWRHLGDRAGDLLDRRHRLLRRLLHRADLGRDLLRRLGRLARQLLHLGRHHGKALAGLAGARRLDGGVERQQVGLAGDGVDQLHHVADPARRVAASSCTAASVRRAPCTARSAICDDCATWEAISRIEIDSSSVAAATVCTLAEVCWAAEETVTDCWVVWPAIGGHRLGGGLHLGGGRGQALRQGRDVRLEALRQLVEHLGPAHLGLVLGLLGGGVSRRAFLAIMAP